MKYIINGCYGGYAVPEEVQQVLGCDVFNSNFAIRTNPYFIEWVESHTGKTELDVVEIPNEATDWELHEYDGLESIIAVVDGKIQHIY